MIEVWKEIPNTMKAYEVSSMGRIRSYRRGGAPWHWALRILGTRSSKIIVASTHHGYRHVTIKFSDRIRTKKVSRLLMESFYGPSDLHVGHLNGIRNDDRIENLKWVTIKENAGHRHLHGTNQFGTKQHMAKLDDDKIRKIKTLKGSGSCRAIGEKFDVSPQTINNIWRGLSWKHVS